MTLIPNNGNNKSANVRDLIILWIKSGKFKAGSRLPSEREISKELNITQKTVRRGLEALEEEGVIVKRARVGNFVKGYKANNSIAMILPAYMLNSSSQHPAAPLFIGGAGNLLARYEYVISTVSYQRHQCWLDAGNVVTGGNFQGAILCTQADVTREELEQFARSGIKIVLLGSHPSAAELDLLVVEMDMKLAVAQLMEGLFKLGHRRICVIDYEESPFREQLERLVQDTCARLDLPPVSDINIPLKEEKPDYSCLAAAIDIDPRPTAFIAADEFVASELFRLCYTRNLRVPQDVSIAARWDCLPHSHPVPLTAPDSVTLARRASETAAQFLLKLLAGEQLLEREIVLKSSVQWKLSTGPVPVSNEINKVY